MKRKKTVIWAAILILIIVGISFVVYYYPKEKNFTKTSLLKLTLPIMSESENTVKIVNYDKVPHDFNVYLNNLQQLALLKETQFSLNKGESKDLIVSFKDTIGEVEVYLGKLIVETEISKEEVPIILSIEDPNHAFAIIKSSIPKYDNVYPGGKLGTEIKIYDLVGTNMQTIDAIYLIKNFEDEILMSSTGNLVVGGSKTELFDIPSNWEKGDYVFITSIDYKGTKSISSHLFTVSDKKAGILSGDFKLFMIIILIFFVAILVLVFYFIKTRDDLLVQLKRQQSAELKRKIRYVQVSKKEIEKSKEHPEQKRRRLLELDKAKKRIIKKIKKKQKVQRRKIKELKKKKQKPKAKLQLQKWKQEGYKMFDAESEMRKITKKGMEKQVKDFKKKGYATGFLKDKK